MVWHLLKTTKEAGNFGIKHLLVLSFAMHKTIVLHGVGQLEQAKNQRIANGKRKGGFAPFRKTEGAHLRKGAFILSLNRYTFLNPISEHPGKLSAEPLHCQTASCGACLSFAFPEACASALYPRHNTWQSHPCA